LGGILGQKLFNKNPSYQPIFISISIFLGIFPCLYLLYAQTTVQTGFFILVNILAGFIISSPIANVRSMLISANLPNERSSVFAIYNLTDDLGKGLGPALSAIILSSIPDRSVALSISILFWLPCALLWIPAILHFKKEEEEVHILLKDIK
jgi:MFS-type transporter involved in bile tolerance (Atg22 family)